MEDDAGNHGVLEMEMSYVSPKGKKEGGTNDEDIGAESAPPPGINAPFINDSRRTQDPRVNAAPIF